MTTLYKTITWRIIGSFVSFCIAYMFFRDVMVSAFFVILDATLKSILYYGHEVAWKRYG